MRSLTTLAASILIILAGCTEGGAPAQSDSDEDFEDLRLDASDDTGVIRGVVVDGTITPVAQVKVVLVGHNQETTTNDKGVFGFSDLDPGTYFLEASRLGYNMSQTSVTVEAGVDRPPVTKILLDANPAALPYFTDFQWQGFFTCSTAAFQVCPFSNSVLCIAGQCGVLNDAFLVHVPIENEPTWINSELVWKSTQPLGEELDFYLEKVNKNDDTSWDHQRSVVGPSPQLLTVNENEAKAMALGTVNDMRHRVFPALSPTTLLFVNQDFEVFSHKFYGYTPPEGWRFTEQSVVPEPPR